MAARSPALAKLTRPKLYDALSRPRLFALIDESARRPIVWLCAPPGAGKTTLVASYLEERRRRHLWYQIDVGDADPATFVHYMRTAALELAGKDAAKLPLFNAEPQQNLARFSRAFFRELFAVLPKPCVVVLDNFHDARTEPEQRAALAQGLEEVPDGITLIVISRSNPPAEFARLLASGRIARIDGAALRCTPDEAAAILGNAEVDRQAVQRIQRQSDGWVAALVLLREHLSRDGAVLDEMLGEGKDAIFDYFAGEIFNRARPQNRRVLMLTAIPGSVTQAEAVALTGNDEAPRLLDYLYRRHLFIDRRRGAQATYHYHALFREFLLAQLEKTFPPGERRAASAVAARLLAERGEAIEALELYRAAQDWQAMRALIVANALDWARQGRGHVVAHWIEALPQAMLDTDPVLQYWLGRAWIFDHPERGRPALERAYAAFRAAKDLRHQALALNTIVTSYYYEWATFAPLDDWLPEFDELLAPDRAGDLDPGSELRARAAYVIALLFRRPDDPALATCARRLDSLIDAESDVNVRIMAASTLLNYFNWKKKGHDADALVARMEPVLARPDATPLMQVWWRKHVSFWHHLNGRYDESNAVAAEARVIAERYGLEAYLFTIDHAEVSALISKGDYAAARSAIQVTATRLVPARRMDRAYFHHLRSNLEQRLGNFTAAVQDADHALNLARASGLPRMQMPHFLARAAHARIAAGVVESGLALLDEAIASADEADRESFEQQREITRSALELDRGDIEPASERLARVLAQCRARQQFVFMRARPDLAARLAAFALEQAIETDFVRTLIARNRWVTPPQAGPAWPFRLRLRVLGGFELVRDDEPVRFTGKTQQRPLDLLKALVAFGGDRVDAQQLMAVLWPDADGAAAKTSFDTTLFRLRKLLDVDNALVLAAGKLSLNRTLAWVD